MTGVDVDALAKLREAATAGPWSATTERANGGAYIDPPRAINAERNPGPAWVGETTIHADAALVVAAVNALPDLLAAVRERDALREAVEGLAAQWLASSVLGLSALAGAGRELRRVLAAVDGCEQ